MKFALVFAGAFCSILFLVAWSDPVVVDSRVTLGRMLFFDPILSKDSTISCASCHKPEYAFSDTVSLSQGVNGMLARRNTPSVMNMAARDIYFFDGRAATLEAQVIGPIENPNEMNLPFKDAIRRINQSKEYRKLFFQIYKKYPDSISIVDAIAKFEKTLETDNTPNDRWMDDNPNAMTASQLKGRELFTADKTKCFECHFTPDFTSDEFKNIGVKIKSKAALGNTPPGPDRTEVLLRCAVGSGAIQEAFKLSDVLLGDPLSTQHQKAVALLNRGLSHEAAGEMESAKKVYQKIEFFYEAEKEIVALANERLGRIKQ